MEWHNQINTSLYYEYDKQAIYFNPEGTFEHPNFWPYVIRMATLGYIEQISSILKHVLLDVSLSRYSDVLPYIMELCDIISNLPPDSEKLEKAINNLNTTRWVHSKTKYHADQISTVMSIFLGNEAVTIEHTQDDIHAYICSRYYRSSVGSFNEFSARNSPRPIPYSSQKVLRSIIAGDIYQAMEECIHYDWWLLAHLTDLLTMNQMIDRDIKIPVGRDILSMPVKTHFILFYASFLKNQFGLWRQAYIYMLECGDLGKEAVVEHLNTMDLNVEDTVIIDVVEFCISQSLESTGLKIYKKKATMCMESNDYKRALFYYEKSKQDQCIDGVFYEMIWYLAKTGNWFDLSSLGPTQYDGIRT
ncbi:nucleoporin Nup85-like protein [Parasitella parasitica]|nr:nucleoporin Nup85-like protein [Parasitella parasitica]